MTSYSHPKWKEEEKKTLFVDLALELATDALVQTYQLASKRL